jgi:hypothetical protein
MMKTRKIIGYIVGAVCILSGLLYTTQEIYLSGILWLLIGGFIIHDNLG